MKNTKINFLKVNTVFLPWILATGMIFLVGILYFIFPYSLLVNQHNYIDQRSLCGLNNAFNVLSNVVLIMAGCYWLNWILRTKNIYLKCRKGLYEARLYLLFFAAIILAGMQSAWYHLFHSQLGLLGTYILSNIVMLSLLSAIIAEHVSLRVGLHSCMPLIFISMLMSFYWYINQSHSQQTYLWYFLTYLVPSLSIVLIVMLKPKYKGIRHITFAISNIFIALGMSCCDEIIYVLTRHMISGQSLHNIYLGIAVIYIGYYLEQRSIHKQDRQHVKIFKSKITYQSRKLPMLIPSRASISFGENFAKAIPSLHRK